MNFYQNYPNVRAKAFWSYQQDACPPEDDACLATCERAGFSFIDKKDGYRTIQTGDSALSLSTLITGTRAAVENSDCASQFPLMGGFWGDSYLVERKTFGTQIYNIIVDISPTQARNLFKAHLESDLAPITDSGLAADIIVDVDYLGGGDYSINIGIGEESLTIRASSP